MDTWMVKLLLVSFFLRTIEASFVDTYNWISIDCGAERATLDTKNLINWETDADYTKSGKNKNCSGNVIGEQMRTLRYFPDGDKNCYSFSVDGITKYLVRARFYYGNYDGLSKPPTFDISVNEFKWTTVVTSLREEPVVIEGTFSLSSDIMSVWLARANDGGVPFISSLEVVPLPFNTYGDINLYSAFLLNSRISFGAKEDVRYTGNYTGDHFNRIWKAEGLPNCNNISAPNFYIGYIPNEVPRSVLLNAIEASRLSDSIVLPLNLTQIQQSLCVMLYFVELNNARRLNDSRRFQIDIGDQKNASIVELQRSKPQLVTLYPELVVGPANITISALTGSTLPPILNAMEVYTVMDMEPTTSPTSQAGSVRLPFFFCLLICILCNFVIWLE